ncbi:MAG TPA: HAD-IC family P-type ATPase, partial [Gemmatimonadaceae bacterium]|nr:HAD-IC family P-type ATPase [Gemmatimonadaceae bacterium]
MVTTLPPDGVQSLSMMEARRRLVQYGPNELVRPRRVGAIRELVRGLASPLMVILLGASVLAASVGEVTDAAIIIVTVLLGAALDAYQTTRSSAAVERLRESVIPTATAYRDGAWLEISRRELVPGDVIHVAAGDVVPADVRLVSSRDLHVQQAALTGESLPAEKRAPAEPKRQVEPTSDPNEADALFLGTSIVSGVGVAVVTATAGRTTFGEIAARLREAPPPTELERGLRRFGALLAETVIFLVLFLVLVSVALRRDPLESLLFAVALAVGIVPEFMPMVTSITLATGATRMARSRVIVKHLAAIQNFGSIDVLCSDKTGTLTRGEMQLADATDARDAKDPRVLTLASVAARLQSGIRNPLDDAIISAGPETPGWEKLDEIPFDFERRRMGVVVRHNGQRLLVVKGAPESILSACIAVQAGSQTQPLDAALREAALGVVRGHGAGGLRTIAVATRELAPNEPAGASAIRDLVLAGWLTFADPPLSDADEM